ncbi:hypothetical protein HaLaN_15057 [Haematococcus lacustris]|uniref:Uncharacterized protein n=1 Tax=Haematococcus lacustris TaxID=44745 RepID=A0A699Z6R9_HAELA|nr:hypothetical protein HaLaN_15057 [Haematococcus lacustris]
MLLGANLVLVVRRARKGCCSPLSQAVGEWLERQWGRGGGWGMCGCSLVRWWVVLSIRVLEHYPGEEQARRMQMAEKRRREEAAVASIAASLTLHTAHAASGSRPKAAPAAPHPSPVPQTEAQPAQPEVVSNGTVATTIARQEKGARSSRARTAGGRPSES